MDSGSQSETYAHGNMCSSIQTRQGNIKLDDFSILCKYWRCSNTPEEDLSKSQIMLFVEKPRLHKGFKLDKRALAVLSRL